jgi:hypothetical protein
MSACLGGSHYSEERVVIKKWLKVVAGGLIVAALAVIPAGVAAGTQSADEPASDHCPAMTCW